MFDWPKNPVVSNVAMTPMRRFLVGVETGTKPRYYADF